MQKIQVALVQRHLWQTAKLHTIGESVRKFAVPQEKGQQVSVLAHPN